MKPPPGLVFRVANQRLKDDPLLTFGWPSDKHKQFAGWVADGLESLLRGSNSSAKTRTGAAIVTAAAEGKTELAGVPLPKLPTPATIWVLTQSYKQQVDASQAAVLYYLGNQPHKITYVAGESKGYVENIWVATHLCTHGGDERCKTCSKIVFHCAESQSAIGGRIDLAWADEPPDEESWREVRMRGFGDRRLYRMITATPIEKRWWGWMPGDFNACEMKPRDGRVEVRVTMHDNRFLLPDVIEDKERAARGDPREDARLYGDYVDLKGESPFPTEKMKLWLKRARDPRIDEVRIRAERRAGDDEDIGVVCKVQIFHDFEEEETYLGVLDPATFLRLDHRTGLVATDWTREGSSSRGVPDPCGIHIYARRSRRLVARFTGYCGAYGLGSLGAVLARRYGNALLDTDLTGGPGEPTVRALRKAGYSRLNSYTASPTMPGHGSDTLGFKMTSANRSEMVAAIQQALLDDSLICESADCVKSLMAVTYVMTPSGRERPEASYGANDEDMICMGRALYLMNTLPLPPQKHITAEDRLSKIAGFRVAREKRQGARIRPLWNPA